MRGSVIQKPAGSGRWYVVLDLSRDGTGRRRQKWHSGYRSKRDAERGLTALLSARDTGTYVEPQRVRLGEYLLERWLPAVESTVRPATYDGYGRHLRRYVVPALGALPLQSVQPDALSVLYRDLLDHGGAAGQPLAAATVRRIHSTVHRALRDAVAWGYLLRNPASVAVKPKQRGVGSVEMRTWSGPELRAFLDHVQGDRLYAAWRLAASTGLRRSELLGLRWVDVDLAAGHVAVRQTLTAVRGKLLFDAPKTARSRRSVALDAETVTALRSWRTAQLEERLAWGEAWQETGMLFTREDGSLIHPDAFSAWWSRQLRQSGLPKIRFHDLRHTHASLALQAGVPAKVVSERLGHATVAFTLDVYSHTIPSPHQDAAEKITALLV